MKHPQFYSMNISLASTIALLCLVTAGPAAQQLLPLPKGVTELKFSEFFVSPVGPRGLELTDKLKALDGKRVRILGYMVARSTSSTGPFCSHRYRSSCTITTAHWRMIYRRPRCTSSCRARNPSFTRRSYCCSPAH